jgi:anti-sigma factor RsiW
MTGLTDEILNRYLDGELSPTELNEVREIFDSSEDARRRLYAMQLVHDGLKKYKVRKPSPAFTSVLMKKIVRRTEPKGQRYFIFSISSIFVLVSLAIIAYLASYIISTGQASSEGNNSVNTLLSLAERMVHGIKTLFTAGNVSLIGFIFSFAIIISAWFFFDSHRQARTKLTKL